MFTFFTFPPSHLPKLQAHPGHTQEVEYSFDYFQNKMVLFPYTNFGRRHLCTGLHNVSDSGQPCQLLSLRLMDSCFVCGHYQLEFAFP
jgi:hypothetical protein